MKQSKRNQFKAVTSTKIGDKHLRTAVKNGVAGVAANVGSLALYGATAVNAFTGDELLAAATYVGAKGLSKAGDKKRRQFQDGELHAKGINARITQARGGSPALSMAGLTPDQAAAFAHASHQFHSQQGHTGGTVPAPASADGKRGWANPKTQAAAKAAQGKRYNGPQE